MSKESITDSLVGGWGLVIVFRGDAGKEKGNEEEEGTKNNLRREIKTKPLSVFVLRKLHIVTYEPAARQRSRNK
jgi:hypothetical protein